MLRARSLAGLLALVLVAIFVMRALWRQSPGALSQVHGVVAGLDGEARCSSCHGPSGAVEAAACEACHDAVAEQRALRRGTHGRPSVREERCERCHSEHHGREFGPTNVVSFRRAGVALPGQGDPHEGLDYRLAGRHRALSCAACHALANKPVLAEGEQRYAGLSQACSSCHDDVHQGRFGVDCASCHGQERPFREAPSFAHDERFPLRGAHGGLECRLCHVEIPWDVFAHSPAHASARACADCHDNPHAPGAKRASPVMAIASSEDCARCHTTTSFASERFGVSEHAAIGVELVGPHARARCSSCHGPGSVADRAEPRSLESCASCHETPHRFEASRALSCRPCHLPADTSFARPPARLNAAAHERCGFALLGRHASARCDACHEPAASGAAYAARFPGRRAGDCAACHDSPHVRLARALGPAQCNKCHSAEHEAFTLPHARFERSAHAGTGFALRGAHARVACRACHALELPGAEAPRSFGERYPGRAQRDCASCHRDPHGGEFTRGEAGGRSCVDCHDEQRFAPSKFTLEDHARTGFELRGAHAAVACDSCHRSPAGERRFRGLARDCTACHEDVHRGQFAEPSGRNDCSRCHAPDGPFERVVFDHSKTRFRLDGSHEGVACAACHKPVGSPPAPRYRGTPRDCASCHAPGEKGRVRRSK